MPVNGYPAGFTNSWPTILHEYSDRAAYEDDPVWKGERAGEANWSRPRPSSVEITRMETAVVRPGRYLGHVPQLLRTVQAVALAIEISRMPREGLSFLAGWRADGIASI